jgi:hypothetical protein
LSLGTVKISNKKRLLKCRYLTKDVPTKLLTDLAMNNILVFSKKQERITAGGHMGFFGGVHALVLLDY